ncbi:MAG: acyl carrier protein [Firmicutes bacterium]|nr:acyl carrier protein [Bacillota bacterium]
MKISMEDLCKVIAEKLNVELARITPDTDIISDLKADSLDIMDMLMSLEEKSGITISNEDAQRIRKVSEIFEVINRAK